MVDSICDKAAIVGIGSTEFSKNSGRSELSLAAEACKAALDDAGLKPSDVDGLVTFTMDTNEEVDVARSLGCDDLSFYARVPYGGGAATGTLHQAAMAIASGMAEVVVCYRALNGRSGHRYSAGVSGNLITGSAIHYGYYTPFGLLTPASWVAMFTQRYMHLTNCPVDALFEVAHSTREYAVNNPAAFFYQRPFTREDYDNARKISDPLKLYDCCQESDGGDFVLPPRDRTDSRDGRRRQAGLPAMRSQCRRYRHRGHLRCVQFHRAMAVGVLGILRIRRSRRLCSRR
jgi:acetyl-CoA acetyltransferase